MQVLKLPGFSGVMCPFWANYICNSSHQSLKDKNILSIPSLVLCKGMLHKCPNAWGKSG